jgi:hypothetical protein
VRLAVYDVAGREVVRLVDGMRPAGEHEVSLEGRGMPSGVYHYRLEGGGSVVVKRCVLLR